MRAVLTLLACAALATPALAADAVSADATTVAVEGPRGPEKPGGHKKKGKGGGGGKRAENARYERNYRTGQVIAGAGVVAGTTGLVVLATGWQSRERAFVYGPVRLHLASGLVSVGGLIASSGALGAAIAVDNASKRPVPLVAGALGLTLGIFAPTFFGVGLGLQSPAFAYAAIATGSVSTLLGAVQMGQNIASRPKKWVAYVDPVGGQLVVSGVWGS